MVLVRDLRVSEEIEQEGAKIILLGSTAAKRTTAMVVDFGVEADNNFVGVGALAAGDRIVIGSWSKPEVVDAIHHAVRETDIVAVLPS